MTYALARGEAGTFQMTIYRAFALIMLSQVMWYFLGESWERLYRQPVHGTAFQTGNAEYARASVRAVLFSQGLVQGDGGLLARILRQSWG